MRAVRCRACRRPQTRALQPRASPPCPPSNHPAWVHVAPLSSCAATRCCRPPLPALPLHPQSHRGRFPCIRAHARPLVSSPGTTPSPLHRQRHSPASPLATAHAAVSSPCPPAPLPRFELTTVPPLACVVCDAAAVNRPDALPFLDTPSPVLPATPYAPPPSLPFCPASRPGMLARRHASPRCCCTVAPRISSWPSTLPPHHPPTTSRPPPSLWHDPVSAPHRASPV